VAHLRNVLKYKKYYKSRRIEMGYSELEFRTDMAMAFNNAWQAADCVANADSDTVASKMFPYYVGDIALKREFQILLDKFSALSDAEMYTETDCDAPEGELLWYRKKAKILLGMMDNKIERINPSKFGLGTFADGRSKMATIEFIKKVQLLIDLM